MTWEDAIEIAKKVTRSEGGQQYAGLQYSNNSANFARGVSMQLVNPATNKAAFNNDTGLKVLNTLKAIYSIPGNDFKGKVLQEFLDGSTAMIPWWAQDTLGSIEEAVDAGKSFNYDVTTYPHFQGYNGIFEPSTGMYVVGKTSKHQDIAFQIISYLTTNEEVQTYAAEFGDFPSLKLKNIDQIFGSSFKVLKGKNVAGMLKGQFLENHPPSPYDSLASAAFNKYTQQFVTGKINDARTTLAQAEEEANKNIADAMK
jgi:multiple sugar transport system substrate-binding protein